MDYFDYLRAIRSSNLSYAQKLVALMIASHYDFSKGEPCYPTNATLSTETNLSISTIVRAKKVLMETGYLWSERQWDCSNKYIPMVPVSTPIVTETNPMVTESTPHSQSEQLNTHINTQENTNKEIDNSNELSIGLSSNKKPEEIITLDTNEIIAPNPLVNKGTAGSAARTKEHQRLLDLADELWA